MESDYSRYSAYFGNRWFSYAHQMHAVEALGGKSVLEIGCGAGVVAAALRCNCRAVTTFDIDPALRPDHVGSVTQMPFAQGEYDVTCCCQVLEHLPYDLFEEALTEIRRVTRNGAVISLPDVGRHVYLRVRLPWLGWFTRDVHLPYAVKPMSPQTRVALAESGHCWEINYEEYPLCRVSADIRRSGWRIERTWRVPEFDWHRFFVLV